MTGLGEDCEVQTDGVRVQADASPHLTHVGGLQHPQPITKELPLEYAVEMNRLVQMQMEGSVG